MDHVVVVDLGYGDCGKGTTVDGLCSAQPVGLVVRFNSGAQAAHNVVLPDGRHHKFQQFGSGTLRGVPTFLSRFVAVEPVRMTNEATSLIDVVRNPDPFRLMNVDRDCLVTTPYHAGINQILEYNRGDNAHGSCGIGFGETVRYALDHPDLALRVADINDRSTLFGKLEAIFDELRDLYAASSADCRAATNPIPTISEVADRYMAWAHRVNVVDGDSFLSAALNDHRVVFEGAQGVLLDEEFGWHPHTTWSKTTFQNADILLAEHNQVGYHLGVLRAHTTRHGYGPHPTEDAELAGVITEPHNSHGRWQGPWRVGHFDGPGHRYAVAAAGRVDGLSVTHLDQTPDALKVCVGYDVEFNEEPGDLTQQERTGAALRTVTPTLIPPWGPWLDCIEDTIGVPAVIQSRGPTSADKTGLNDL